MKGQAIWWLIERTPQVNSLQFFNGYEWVASASQAAKFPTKQAAQSVIDRYVVNAYGRNVYELERMGAYVVEHAWATLEAQP